MGKKDTQTTLLGHIILKSSDISNFIYISWRNRFKRQKDVYSVLSKLISIYLSKVSGKKYTKQSFRSIYRNSAVFLGYINSFF